MVIVPFLYFAFLMRYFYLQNSKCFSVSAGIAFIFCVSAFFSILIDFNNMYNEWGINAKSINILYTILYCVGITILIYPFAKIRVNKIKTVELKNGKLFDIIAWISIISCMITLFFSLKDLPYALAQNMRDVKSDFNEYGLGEKAWYEEIISIFSSNMALIFCLFFYSISFLKKPLLFNVLLFFSSLALVLSQFVIAGRTAFVYWFLYLYLFYLLYKRFIPIEIKKYFLLSLSFVLYFLILLFLIITIDRFEDSYGYNNSPVLSIIGYAGQQFNNFCSFIEASHNTSFTIERIMPITNHFILGNSFDQRAFYLRVFLQSGIEVNRFATILGALTINIGILGACIYMFVYYFFAAKVFSKMRGVVDFSYFLLFSFFISIPVQGLFGLPNTSVGASLNMFYTFVLFCLFKRRIVFR